METRMCDNFITVIKQEVVPALGCTEPVAVALAASIAVRKLSSQPKHIVACVSPNLMKNGMGVMVPGTGMAGLPIAAAIGAVAGDPDAGLEVLKNVTESDVNNAKMLLCDNAVTVKVINVSHFLYARVTVSNDAENVTVTIADDHTRVISIEENGVTTFMNDPTKHSPLPPITSVDIFKDIQTRDLYDFAANAPIEKLAFIGKSGELNNALSEEGLTGNYGLQIGATFERNVKRGLLCGGLLTEVLMRTSSASDARMGGATKPAMTNSGSGNQGITVTMPVVVTAEHIKASQEQTIRALILAHLVAIYIKSRQNKLSALCGATTAAMGAAAGITYLLGGSYLQISYAIRSMIGDISGMICDGAKPSCAMKVSSSAGAAVKASLMAIDGICVGGNEGIVADDVDDSIVNLSALANGSMTQTDVQILEIMVKKEPSLDLY